MSELLFVAKTFIFTLVFVLLMQYQLGGSTLENRFENWVQKSTVTSQFQKAAAGATLWCKNNFNWAEAKVKGLWRESISQRPSASEIHSEERASR